MKRLYLACLIVLLLSVVTLGFIEYDPGYLLISYGHYTIESTFWVALILLVLLCLFLVVVFRVISRLLNGSFAINRWLRTRSYRRGQVKTAQGIIAYMEGNWQQARRMLSYSAEQSETPLINYLLAARASNMLDDDTQTRDLLRKSEESTSGSDVAVHIAQAQMQLEKGYYERSLATLTRLRKNANKHPYVLKLLQSAYNGLQDWNGLAELLPELRKHNIIDKQEFESLSVQCCKAQLQAIAVGGNSDDIAKKLSDIWSKKNKSITKNSELVAIYAQTLLSADDQSGAEKIIRTQLNREWSQALIDLYGLTKGRDTNKQLLHAEEWLKERNNDARLFLCLGRLSLRNELWGKAKEYFEISFKLAKSGEASAELGRLLAQLGDYQKSNDYYQQGLLLSTKNLPELPLPPQKH